jgi:hypothetical protein
LPNFTQKAGLTFAENDAGFSRRGKNMKDMQTSLEQLRANAVEAALVRDLATDAAKRELYARLADHLAALAVEVEQALAAQEPPRPPEQPRSSS